MKDDMIEPMDSEMRGLLKRGAPMPEASPEAQKRVFEKLQGSLPLIAGVAAGALVSHAAKNMVAKGGATLVSFKVGAAVAVAFVLGTGTGVVVSRSITPERVRVEYRDVKVHAPAPPPSIVRVEDLPVAPPIPSGVPLPESSAGSGSSTFQMNAERALLNEATTAFTHDEPGACLAALEKHKSRFPGGTLSEEREALAVRSLVALGRNEEAVRRGRAFMAKYPGSLMFPAVESAVKEASREAH